MIAPPLPHRRLALAGWLVAAAGTPWLLWVLLFKPIAIWSAGMVQRGQELERQKAQWEQLAQLSPRIEQLEKRFPMLEFEESAEHLAHLQALADSCDVKVLRLEPLEKRSQAGLEEAPVALGISGTGKAAYCLLRSLETGREGWRIRAWSLKASGAGFEGTLEGAQPLTGNAP